MFEATTVLNLLFSYLHGREWPWSCFDAHLFARRCLQVLIGVERESDAYRGGEDMKKVDRVIVVYTVTLHTHEPVCKEKR